MKIHIRKYWDGTKIREFLILFMSPNRAKSITDIIENLYLKIFKDTIKIHEYDIYDLDETLAQIIHPSLVLLKHVKHGVPHVDNDDLPSDLHDKTIGDKWDYVLNEMIYAFDCHRNREYLKKDQRRDDGLKLFGRYYGSLWD